MHRLRPPRGCPFESRPPAPHPHASPTSRFALSERSPRPSHALTRGRRGRPPRAAARRRAPPHRILNNRRGRVPLFKYHISVSTPARIRRPPGDSPARLSGCRRRRSRTGTARISRA
ncbi:hypothetical protein DJ81_05695 [Halorubrum sp. Hd13]|nr:hypothetical protein DJ81_05695 [Halorubrum sp. Hd13]